MNNFFAHCITRYKFYALTLLSAALIICLAPIMPWTYALPELAHSANSFVDSIGVAVHLNYTDTAYGNYDSVIKPRLQELGVRHIRDGVSLKDLKTQEKFKDLATLGIKSTLVIDPRGFQHPQEAIDVAKLIPTSVEAVDGPNEWDVNSGLTYNGQTFPSGVRNYQAELYSAIKGNSATVHLDVLSPSMAIPWNSLKLGIVPCDFGTMHSYAGGGIPSADLNSKWIPATQIMCGMKPIIATECGWHNATNDIKASQSGVSEQASRKYVPRLYLEYFNRNIKRAFIYEFINERPGADQESNFGLLRYDGSQKPAYLALKNLISLLNDPGASFSPESLDYTLSGGGDMTNVHHTLLQKRNGTFYLILWLEVPSFNLQKKTDIPVFEQQVTLSLKTPISKAITYQPINSTTPISQYMNPKQLTLSVPDHPLVVQLVPNGGK